MDESMLQFVKDDLNENAGQTLMELVDIMIVYRSAIKEISTKLDILNDEFQVRHSRNPIEHMKSRIKSPKSIINKLQRKNLGISVQSAVENLNDIAGIRVVCSFIDDIYQVADLLKSQDDITVIEEKDYIKNPKPNGYRSLHMVLEIPVFFSDRKKPVRVEIQIRTIAMDFWASLEHKLYYKAEGNVPAEIRRNLKKCADVISATDVEMQNIHKEVEKLL